MFRLLSSLALTLTLALFAKAQVPPEKCLATMKAADGFNVELFASEPMLINPTSMDVDHKGRVWIAEAVNYRRKNFNRPILRNEGDRIVVLIDKDGDGKADESVTFYQGPEIYGPLGVCVAPYPDGKGQKVFVCQSPDILVFEDKDGDLKAGGPPGGIGWRMRTTRIWIGGNCRRWSRCSGGDPVGEVEQLVVDRVVERAESGCKIGRCSLQRGRL